MKTKRLIQKGIHTQMFLGGTVGKASICHVGDPGWIPGLGSSPEEGSDNPLQYSCLGNFVDRETWWATVHRVTESWTRLIH